MAYDVIVVGGGAEAGVAARELARAGLAVLQLAEEEPAESRVIGEAVEPTAFDELGLPEPRAEGAFGRLTSYRNHPPSGGTVREFPHQQLLVDRQALDARLQAAAADAGAELRRGVAVEELIVQGGAVAGVVAQGERLEARLTIDASGVARSVRRRLPASQGIPGDYPAGTLARAWRLQYRQGQQPDQEVDVYLRGHGKYFWRSPFDVGCRTPDRSDDLAAALTEFALVQGRDPGSAPGGMLATDEPMGCHPASLVGDGVLLLGDAAGMRNPISGHGQGTAMLAARAVAEVAARALRWGRADRETLWAYNLDYHRHWGADLASLDVMRRFFGHLGPQEVDYLWERELVTDGDLEVTFNGELALLSLAEKLRRLARASRNLGFLIDLDRCMELGKKVRRHFLDFPRRPDDLTRWEDKAHQLLESVPRPALSR